GRAGVVRPGRGGRRPARPAPPASHAAWSRSARPRRAAQEGGQLMETDVVTGAFGYSGAAIARELRAAGRQVRTLTGHPGSGADAAGIDTRPLDFSDPGTLAANLAGAHTLYCTYWVRFPYGTATRESAVVNSKALFDAAARAGVARIVYVSIMHADTASPYPYFSGKGEVERHLAAGRRPVRDRPARHLVRLVGRPRYRRERPGQQHRLAVAAPAGLRYRRRRRLPGPAHSRGRPGPALRRARRAARQRDGRRGGAGRADLPRYGHRDPLRDRQPVAARAGARAADPATRVGPGRGAARRPPHRGGVPG